jgi:predicted glutamine amidotransferase
MGSRCLLRSACTLFGDFTIIQLDHKFKVIGIMAFCSTNLHWITRRAPFGKATLVDSDWIIDFQKETTPNDVVTVVATQPLTQDEQWSKIAAGNYVLFKHGELL